VANIFAFRCLFSLTKFYDPRASGGSRRKVQRIWPLCLRITWITTVPNYANAM